MISPLSQLSAPIILDGGLATELEARGFDLNDKLWSARLLLENPDAIRQLHTDYLKAGADIIISASYQASIPGFAQRGIRKAQAIELIRFSLQLALEARDGFWQEYTMARKFVPSEEQSSLTRKRPLVAASVGPYGAFLADGSEYTGDYGVGTACIKKFHAPRWQVLATSGADLLAVETIPNYDELVGLVELLKETPDVWAWFSFACRDDQHISDGTPLAKCVALLQQTERVAAIGINCTAPRFLTNLIHVIRDNSDKPIVVYPNSGEGFDAGTKTWFGERDPLTYAEESDRWREAGATVIGGCCRTGVEHVGELCRHFRQR
jgi:homocysteine S-methyltransferase